MLHSAKPFNLEQVVNGVVHPVSKETVTKYKKSIEDPTTRVSWTDAIAKELGQLVQGYSGTKYTKRVDFVDLANIANSLKEKLLGTHALLWIISHRKRQN